MFLWEVCVQIKLLIDDFSITDKDQFRPVDGEHFEGDLRISQGMMDYYYGSNNLARTKIIILNFLLLSLRKFKH